MLSKESNNMEIYIVSFSQSYYQDVVKRSIKFHMRIYFFEKRAYIFENRVHTFENKVIIIWAITRYLCDVSFVLSMGVL